jgi:hypothetical protein
MQLRIRFRAFSFQRIHADFKNEILFHKAKRFVRVVLFYNNENFSVPSLLERIQFFSSVLHEREYKRRSNTNTGTHEIFIEEFLLDGAHLRDGLHLIRKCYFKRISFLTATKLPACNL